MAEGIYNKKIDIGSISGSSSYSDLWDLVRRVQGLLAQVCHPHDVIAAVLAGDSSP